VALDTQLPRFQLVVAVALVPLVVLEVLAVLEMVAMEHLQAFLEVR
jgi:hypothetical protein